jgi:hypothetical protein
MPLKIPLTHYVSPPFIPPTADPEDEEAFSSAVDQFHAELVAAMQLLMDKRVK